MKKGLIFRVMLCVGLVLVLYIQSLSFVSAGIYMSSPDNIYNLGDTIELNLTIDPIKSGPLKIKLICDENSRDIFNGPVI
jgi:hypothetical protein